VKLIHGAASPGSGLCDGWICHPIENGAELAGGPEARQPEMGRIAMAAAVADHRAITPWPTKRENKTWQQPAWRGDGRRWPRHPAPKLVAGAGRPRTRSCWALRPQSGDVMPQAGRQECMPAKGCEFCAVRPISEIRIRPVAGFRDAATNPGLA